MEGDFTPHKPGYYEVKNVAEIEDFDKDDYGNTWFNVVFQGDAETFMWLAKNRPEEGKRYYGHLEPTRSGKRLRFKTDKIPEGAPIKSASKPSSDYEPGTNARWAIGLAYRAYVQVMGSPEGSDGNFPFDEVQLHATRLVEMFESIKNGLPGPKSEQPQSLKQRWEHATNTKATRFDDDPGPSDGDYYGE